MTPLNWTNERCVLPHGHMRPDTVVIGSIGLEDVVQVSLAKD